MSQERSLNSGLSITIAIQTVLQRSPVFLAIIPKSRTLKKICVSHFAAKLELLRLLFMVLNETICTFFCTFYCGDINRFDVFSAFDLRCCLKTPVGCFKKFVNIRNSKMQMSPSILQTGLWTYTFQFNLRTSTGIP